VIDRQARDLPLDAHLHTTFSHDSDVSIDTYAEQAVERAIAEIAITDHVDFAPGAPGTPFVDFADRERTAREAAERWAPRGLAIRFGTEITWDSRFEDDIVDHLRRHTYDFVIGSVHVFRDSPFAAARAASWVAGKRLPDIVAPYFDEVALAAQSGLFDALGHLDFVKRFLHPHVLPSHLAEAPELYEPILRALVESGTALEVNTSGLRQEPGETYPSASVVRRFRELGGRAVTVGSDAHRPDSFAFGLADGYGHVRDAGFDQLTFRRGGERETIDLAPAPNASPVQSL
jgi:histidinol-phosphatase (PHP family)